MTELGVTTRTRVEADFDGTLHKAHVCHAAFGRGHHSTTVLDVLVPCYHVGSKQFWRSSCSIHVLLPRERMLAQAQTRCTRAGSTKRRWVFLNLNAKMRSETRDVFPYPAVLRMHPWRYTHCQARFSPENRCQNQTNVRIMEACKCEAGLSREEFRRCLAARQVLSFWQVSEKALPTRYLSAACRRDKPRRKCHIGGECCQMGNFWMRPVVDVLKSCRERNVTSSPLSITRWTKVKEELIQRASKIYPEANQLDQLTACSV